MAVKHLFVLMLENRSFDHMLGFADLSGFHAVTGQPSHADDLIQLQTSPDWSRTGNIDPRSGTVVYPQPGAPVKLYPPAPGPSHEFLDVLMQLCGPGALYPDATTGGYPPVTGTGFVHNYAALGAFDPTLVMKCFESTQVPVLTALAREFAVSDHWFSSLPGPTWPNRHFVHAASSGGLDDSPPGLTVLLQEIGPGYEFENGTIFDRLGDDWLVFHGDALPHVFSIKGMLEPRLEGHFQPQERFREIVSADDFTAQYVFIEPHYGRVYGDYAYGTSQHPLDDVTLGEQLIKDIYEAIRNSPHWNDSALVVTYDEHGGFYDHVVPPPATAPGDRALAASSNQHNFDFTRLGVRVPAVIVSPLIPRGTIDDRVYNHASIPATLIDLFDLPAVGGRRNLTNRDATSASFKDLFRLSSARIDTPETLPSPSPGAPVPTDPDADAIIDGNIDPNVRGFLYVALLREFGLTPDEIARSPIAQRYMRISTRLGAMQCIERVRRQFAGG